MISIPYLICSILSFVPAIVCHEACHGFAAYKLGDPTAKRAGRLSFNPLKHIDPFGTVIMPLLLMAMNMPVFGYAKPVPYNPAYFKDPRKGDLIVGLAGPAANLVLAILGAAVYTAIMLVLPVNQLAQNEIFYYFLTLFLPMFSLINLYLMFFNLLPIPPLDGSSIFAFFLPAKLPALSFSQGAALRDAGVPRRGAPRAVRAALQPHRHLPRRDGRQACSTCCSPSAGRRGSAVVSYKVRIDSFEGRSTSCCI